MSRVARRLEKGFVLPGVLLILALSAAATAALLEQVRDQGILVQAFQLP